jgi:hypothetical protein
MRTIFESASAPSWMDRVSPSWAAMGVSWALLAILVFTWEPMADPPLGAVVAVLAASSVAAAVSALLPHRLRRAGVRTTRLPRSGEPDMVEPSGAYREPPPMRSVPPDAADLRAAAITVAAQGLGVGIVFASAVSFGGLALGLLGGPPALVALLFVGSWLLMALHRPDLRGAETMILEQLGHPGAPLGERSSRRNGDSGVPVLIGLALLLSLAFWRREKSTADWADRLSERSSTALATIDDRRVLTSTYCDQSGCYDQDQYVIEYHLMLEGTRHAGTSGKYRCYEETTIGGTAAVIYDPARPSENLLLCSRKELAKRRGERAGLLLAGVFLGLLVMAWPRSGKREHRGA